MLDHWRIADNPQRIAHYALIEGQILISHDDFVRARQLLLMAFRRLDSIYATWAEPYRLRLHLRVADTYLGTEQPLEARQWYTDALMLARRLKEVHATADALVGMARANSAEQQHDSYVRRLFLEAIHLYDSINVPHSLAAALWALGVLSLDQFRLDEARSSFERCLRIFYEQRDQQGVGLVLGRLGYVAFHERRFDLAYQCLQEAILIAQHIGNRFALAQHLNNLALVYREWGETARMIECYQGVLVIAEAIGNDELAGLSLSNLAFAASEEQRVEDAGRLYAEALKVLRRSGKPDKLASALANVALFNIKREQWEDVEALLLEWTAIVRNVGAYATIHGLMGWVLWLAHHGQHIQAAEWLGMYLANKRTGFDDHHDVEYCRARCGAILGDAEMEAAIERGRALPLEREFKHIQTRFRHGDDVVTTEE
jgi:tetratricopeptide (TPR) repeat protein